MTTAEVQTREAGVHEHKQHDCSTNKYIRSIQRQSVRSKQKATSVTNRAAASRVHVTHSSI